MTYYIVYSILPNGDHFGVPIYAHYEAAARQIFKVMFPNLEVNWVEVKAP